nr:hypothetical protein [Tanacetum cinerariifolium]
MNKELPQTLPSFDTTCYSDKENLVPCVSKPNFVDESLNIFNPPPQPPIYSCEFCRRNAQCGHYCTPQVPFINPKPGYSQDFNFPSQTTLMEQMTTLTSMCEMLCQIVQNKQEEKRIEEEQATNAQYWKIPACCDNDDDYNSKITPVLSTEEPVDSLSIPDTMCDVNFVNNPTPLKTKDHFESVIKSKDDISSSDEDSLYNENIEYVEASPYDFEVVSLEVAEIVIPEDEEIKDDNLRKKLLNSSSSSPKSFLEETNTFHNSLLEFDNFYFDLEEISSGSTTTHSDISLSNYEAFYFDDDHIEEISCDSTTTHSDISLSNYEAFYFDDDHIEEISCDSTTTHSDISLSEYDSFVFDLSNDQFPPIDKSNFPNEEFDDELVDIISPLEYDCFYFRNLPDPGELISSLNSGVRENLSSTTCVYLLVKDSHSLFLAYVVWIFLAYLTYLVIPPYLHPFGNEDTIFDPGITINRLSLVYLIGVELSRNSILTVVT